MQMILGIVCVLFGALGWTGQLLSAVSFERAQRLGLQEKSEETDLLFRLAERHAAVWDALVLWPMILCGVLILLDHSAWPAAALVAGGIYLDAAGRETAKIRSLSLGGIRIGGPSAKRIQRVFFALMAGLAAWLLVYAVSIQRFPA